MIKPINYHIEPNKFVKFATNMTKSGVYLPIILLEGFVVSGRTYQAYKRGGMTEARERALEESTGSLVWLGGAPFLCKLGNNIAKKLGGIKDTDFDIGKDSLRNPIDNVVKASKGVSKTKLAGFKFANTLFSVFAAASFLGFVVPKLNQKLTKLIHKSNKSLQIVQQSQPQPQPVQSPNKNDNLNVVKEKQIAYNAKFKDMDKFLDSASDKNAKNVAFKGLCSAETIATMTHKLENDAVCKLLSTDAVVVTGRGSNARNADECREILFRDIVSSFFYLGAFPLVTKGLTMIDNKIVKGNTNIDPYSAVKIHNYLVDTMPGNEMSVSEFEKLAFGTFNKAEFDKLIFDKDDIISLDAFKKVISDKQLQEKALEMSKMQPMKDGVSILTKQQAELVMMDGKATDPKFIKSVLNNIFGSLDSKEDVLANPNKFISRKKIEKSTKYIQDYVSSVMEYAKKHDISSITKDTLLKVNKRNLYYRFAFMTAGFTTAALFLSTIIPKMQYYITKMKTGSDKFPGARNLD